MRYAIPVTENNVTRLTQPVDVPSPVPFGGSARGFLLKMFPDIKDDDQGNSPWVIVADNNVAGAVLQQDGTYRNPSAPSGPQANTPNNPYFGKPKLSGSSFIGLCIGVLGVVATNRVTTAKSFDAIKMWVMSEGVVIDPDDRAGQFLALTGVPGADGYLTTALAEDGQPLLTRTQRDSIMAAWR